MIRLKTPEQIQIMKEGGKKLAEVLRLLVTMVQVGAKTSEIDKEAEQRIRSLGGEPAFKGYRAFGIPIPFSGSICVSINEEVVHGSPYPERELKEGDIVSIDVGMKYNGYYTDTAYTVGLGRLSSDKLRLISTAQSVLALVIEEMNNKILTKQVVTTADVGLVTQEYVESAGFNVVRELVGHGIGKQLHEDPAVPNFRVQNGEILKPGAVIAIEPMIYMGKEGIDFEQGGWRVATSDGGPAAHFEHTVAIMEDGVVVLTAAP